MVLLPMWLMTLLILYQQMRTTLLIHNSYSLIRINITTLFLKIKNIQISNRKTKPSGSEIETFSSEITKALSDHQSENYTNNAHKKDSSDVFGDLSNQISNLLNQINNLQQEVNDLKDKLEVQKHVTEQLALKLEQNYENINARLSPQETQKIPSDAIPLNENKTEEGEEKNEFTLPDNTERSVDDAAAYENAFKLISEKKFNEAITAFNNFIIKYPKSQHVSSALYWLGEIYSANRRNGKSKRNIFKDC